MLNCKPHQNVIAVGGKYNCGKIFRTGNIAEREVAAITDCGRAVVEFGPDGWSVTPIGSNLPGITVYTDLKWPSQNLWEIDRPARWYIHLPKTQEDGSKVIIELRVALPLFPDDKLRPLIEIRDDETVGELNGLPADHVIA